MTDYIIVKEYTKTYNIAANTSAMNVTFNTSTPSGYTPVNWNVTDCGTYGVACTFCNYNFANFRNLTSAAFNNITAKLRVTYVKA